MYINKLYVRKIVVWTLTKYMYINQLCINMWYKYINKSYVHYIKKIYVH